MSDDWKDGTAAITRCRNGWTVWSANPAQAVVDTEVAVTFEGLLRLLMARGVLTQEDVDADAQD